MSTSKELRDKAYNLKAEGEILLAESRKLEAEERRKEREIYYAKEKAKIEKSKAKLAKEFNLLRNAKFERAYEIAWEYGHASSFDEVENYFCELADLLKP